ncbi:MAG: glycosyltransferase [Bacillota bacterium]
MQNRISLCMIVKNEEQNIRRCLGSVGDAVDEIVVVDTGSTDSTVDIAREYGALVYHFTWNGNFSDARNASLEHATGDWILFLDADEELAGESRDVLRRITASNDIEGYFVRIINYLGKEGWIESCPDLVFRLFRNRSDYRFRGAIHEQIVDVILERNGNARYQVAEDLVIIHYGYLHQQIETKDKKNRNLSILQQELAAAPDNRLLRYHYGVELYRAERYAEAAAELVKAANGIDPQTIYLPKLLRYIVLCYQAAGMPHKSLEVVDLGLRLFPDYADLYYYGGLCAMEMKKYAQAYDFFQKALATPEQRSYYAPFSGLRGFRCYYQLGRVAEIFANAEEAMRFYVLSLRDNPSFVPALERITALLEPQKDPVYAENCLNQLCEFCTPEANLLMGKILFGLSAYKLALKYLERGIDAGAASAETELWKAICLIQEKRHLEALRILNNFDPQHHLYPLATLNRLLCFWLRGNRRKSRQIADELFAMGLSAETGAVVELLRDSSGRRRTRPVSLGTEGMNLLLDIVARALDLGEVGLATSLLERLDKGSLNQNAGVIGELFYRYDYLEEAERYLSLRLDTESENVCILSTLAEIKQRQNLYTDAADLYHKTLALEPGEPRHYVKLIRLYEEMRRRTLEEARTRYPEVPVFRTLLEEAQLKTWITP